MPTFYYDDYVLCWHLAGYTPLDMVENLKIVVT